MRSTKHAEVDPPLPPPSRSLTTAQFVNHALQDINVKKIQKLEALQQELSASAYLVKKAQDEIGQPPLSLSVSLSGSLWLSLALSGSLSLFLSVSLSGSLPVLTFLPPLRARERVGSLEEGRRGQATGETVE
jgi:hypothetical protein